MKKIAILGSTGSIGVNALDVVSKNPQQLKVVALAAGRNLEVLKGQIERFRPKTVSVLDKEHAGRLKAMFGTASLPEILWGEEGARSVASAPGADMVLSAMPEDAPNELFKRFDQLLSQSKRNGRNQFTFSFIT